MSRKKPEPTEDDVREALRTVAAPDGDENVVAAGLVASVTIADGTVTVNPTLSGMEPATRDMLADRMRTAVLECGGVEEVRIETDMAEPDHGTVVPGVDRIIAVASAKGGVGKTTVATQLARGLAASDERVGLFDADVYGPNTPDLLDIDGPLGSTDDGRAEPVEVDGLQVVSVGLVANDEPVAWRGAMAHEAVEELLTDAAWDADTLVLDLPPGTGDIVLTTLQSFPVDGVVFVTTPFPTAASDTERSAALFREEGVPILGAVVNMAGFTCPTCGDDHAPFGSEPDLSTDVLTELPIDESLRSTEGPVPAAFRKLGDDVREALPDNQTVSIPETALDLRGVPDRARIEQVHVEFDALAPGESLHLLTDTRPGDVRGVLEDFASVPLRVATERKGPSLWALQLSKADPEGTEEVTC